MDPWDSGSGGESTERTKATRQAEVLPPVDSLGLPAGTQALKVGGNYSTAISVAKQRNIHECARRLVEECEMLGKSGYYGWGEGKNAIEGKSKELAFAAARVWGNCAVEYGQIQNLPDSWVLTAYFIDLETGFTIGRPFRMAKNWEVHGKFDEARKADIRFQIGASKAARNVILNALPEWLTDKALEACKAGVRAKLEKWIKDKGLPAAQASVVDAFKKAGVPEANLLHKMAVASATALDTERLVMLHGTLRAIQAGEVDPAEAFPSPGAAAASGAPAEPAGPSALDSLAGSPSAAASGSAPSATLGPEAAKAATTGEPSGSAGQGRKQARSEPKAAKAPATPRDGGTAATSERYPLVEAPANTGEPPVTAAASSDEPATTSDAPAAPTRSGPEGLDEDQIKDLRAAAAARSVSFDALEERFGGPLAEFRMIGLSPVQLEARVLEEIERMAKGSKK